jgi:hypothetical protein
MSSNADDSPAVVEDIHKLARRIDTLEREREQDGRRQ